MGAWGEGPLESDGALDWVGNNVTDPLTLRIKALCDAFDSEYRRTGHIELYAEDIRAAAECVTRLNQLHPVIDGFNVYVELISRLGVVQEDEAWLSTWTSNEFRENVRTSIDHQIRALRRIMESFQVHV